MGFLSFALTPALSQRERGNHSAAGNQASAWGGSEARGLIGLLQFRGRPVAGAS